MTSTCADLVAQLDGVLQVIQAMRKRSKYDDLSDLLPGDFGKFPAQAQGAVHRVAGQDSVYAKQIDKALTSNEYEQTKCLTVAGIVEGLRDDLNNGYVLKLAELIHGELFGDFLGMADHLLDEGYKDAAAVIVGGTLEGHLRQLCNKHSIPVEVSTSSGLRPKKADQMNNDLAGANAYTKLDQKSVTAWLDLRNKAAHGQYDQYSHGLRALDFEVYMRVGTRNSLPVFSILVLTVVRAFRPEGIIPKIAPPPLLRDLAGIFTEIEIVPLSQLALTAQAH